MVRAGPGRSRTWRFPTRSSNGPSTVDHVSEVLCTDSSLHREVVVSRAKALWASPPKSLPPACGGVDGWIRSIARLFLSRQLQQIKQGCLREAVREAALEISKDKEQSPVGPTVREHPRHAGGCDNRFAFRGHIKKLRETGAMRGP